MELDFVSALPGIVLRESRSRGRYRLLSPNSSEYATVASRDAAVASYLGRFSTPFGVSLKPAMICVTRQTQRPYAEDLVAFRDCIAIPAIIEARRQRLITNRPIGFSHSDSFDFYPVNLGIDHEYVTLRTPTEEGLHDLAAFSGQPTPLVLHPYHQEVEFDEVLLEPLLALFDAKRMGVRTRVLRSLHAAYAACRAPFHHLGGSLDVGMTTSLWVTAFEILAHPGGSEDVTWEGVNNLIEKVDWPDEALRTKGQLPVLGAKRKKPRGSVSAPVQLYEHLYAARCAYLHGEPELDVAWEILRGPLQEQAAVLYRFVLLRVLADAGLYSFPRAPHWEEGMSEERRALYLCEFGRWHHEHEVGKALLGPVPEKTPLVGT